MFRRWFYSHYGFSYALRLVIKRCKKCLDFPNAIRRPEQKIIKALLSNSLLWSVIILLPKITSCQPADYTIHDVKFESRGVILAGSILTPRIILAAVVIVHGSDPVKRELDFAKRLTKEGIAVLTYDKRGVGESGGVYAGPSVGTNNIDTTNLNLLSHDANAAVNTFRSFLKDKKIPIGVVGFSQAGWIIPIAASNNPEIEFMVLFSCPTITTLEQLRFQFYTSGNADFWDTHSEADVREHIKNDADRYQFAAFDPKIPLNKLSIPGLWLYGGKDIQIPVTICIVQLNGLKVNGRPFEYCLFPDLAHNTSSNYDTAPVDISIDWIKQKALNIQQSRAPK